MKNELRAICEQWLGRPYFLAPCGEGEQGYYDQFPLYTWDRFDCVTFVNAVLAYYLSESEKAYQDQWILLNYKENIPCFLQRMHFIELDWNQQQQKKGWSVDQTRHIVDAAGQSCAKMASCMIECARWFSFRTIEDMRLPSATRAEKQARLEHLKQETAALADERCDLWYLPWDALFKPDGSITAIWHQFPQQGIVEIVRPNWQIRDKIGTCLNISHLGILLREKNNWCFYHASRDHGVVKVELAAYLNQFRCNDTIKGIHLRRCLTAPMAQMDSAIPS